MMTTPTNDLAALDAQIAQAEHDLDTAQNRFRSRPRKGATLGQGPVQIDREARAYMLDLGLDVDRAVVAREQLKKQRAELALAELEDSEAMAAEAAAVETAHRDVTEAETRAVAARTAYQVARGAQKQRAERITTQRAEIARADAAIRSAENLLEREQTERSVLIPA